METKSSYLRSPIPYLLDKKYFLIPFGEEIYGFICMK